MRIKAAATAVFFLLSATFMLAQSTTSPLPAAAAAMQSNNWVDAYTGHRIFKLTAEDNSKGLYFNENAFTPDGAQMVYLVHDPKITEVWEQGIYVVDLTTLKSRQLVPAPVSSLVVARKSPTVYFTRPGMQVLYAVDVNTGQIQKIASLPARADTISSLNADETLIAGVYTEFDPPQHTLDPATRPISIKGTVMDARFADKVPMDIYTLDIKTRQVKSILYSKDWLDHVQFSPTDPTLLMYAHEGPWQKVDRIWTIRADGTDNKLIHKRTINGEIAGHEFWDADGKTIWYDLQIPKGQNFYLASYNTQTKARKWYSVERDAWSIHYNAASDDSIFCGDGGDYAQVAHSRNGQWIELFKPKETPAPDEIDQTGLVQSGFLEARHLVSMAKHNYLLEPNVRFSPDHKLVLFTSNMLGPSYVYAVEVAKASATPAPAAGQ
jgi:oligogalacturonide lyase